MPRKPIKHKCIQCGETDPTKFYGHKKSMCYSCNKKDTLDRRKKKKNFIVEHLGGKCMACGFDKYMSGLQVHHLDPSVKDKHFRSFKGWSEQRLVDELQGCVLLCACCHSAVHAGELDIGV